MIKKYLISICMIGIALIANDNFDKATEQFNAKDYKNAYLNFNKACKEGVKKACTMNAIMLFNGSGVKKDNAQAEQIFEKMCNENEFMACEKLGEMYAYGLTKNKQKDEEKTKALFKKSCDGGYKPACELVKE
ncbi:tetratricopeptide repeat protein [Campylobacter pinnipediorum]|uniref:tetratricopeptide repeat protein n=1 Tax=Campylobacter pinnipediorum TaxID=1965231 RepID=UPI00084D08A9|nr:tetratricopeptide repeat protein [Campylobacter pinnipediorum]AQW81446.1 Sel1 domain-containing protein [Campylobacter pinnipediorum subsp. pinnipediorum]OPA78284.1 serine protease [Campylobacter pinnipediorum subsp. pinnipediorum]